MSATAARAATKLPRRSPAPEPLRLQVVEWTVSLGVVLALAAVLSQQTDQVLRSGWELVAWIVTVVITDLLPVPLWSDNVLSLSLPILLAAAMVYSSNRGWAGLPWLERCSRVQAGGFHGPRPV